MNQKRGEQSMMASAVMAVTVLMGAAAIPIEAQSVAGQAQIAQSTTRKQPAFDVASVKPNKSENRPTTNVPLGPGDVYTPNGGFFSATNQPLAAYFYFAYRIMSNQRQYVQQQLPAWVSTERFDIKARVEGNPS